MVFGFVKKEREFHVGDEILPGGKTRYPSSTNTEKLKKFGIAFGRVYVRGLKATGKSLVGQPTKSSGKKVIQSILGIEPHRTIPELKEEIKRRKLQNQLKELKKSGSDQSGIRILKSIQVPDYINSVDKPGPTNSTSVFKPVKSKKKAPWEII